MEDWLKCQISPSFNIVKKTQNYYNFVFWFTVTFARNVLSSEENTYNDSKLIFANYDILCVHSLSNVGLTWFTFLHCSGYHHNINIWNMFLTLHV